MRSRFSVRSWAVACFAGRPSCLREAAGRSGVCADRWRKWVWRYRCIRPSDGHLRASARVPAGRRQPGAAWKVRSWEAGTRNPVPPGSRPGSSRRGSWSLGGRCWGTSPPRSRPRTERRRSASRTSPPPDSTGRRRERRGPREPARGPRTPGCPAEGERRESSSAAPRRRNPSASPSAGRGSAPPRGFQADQKVGNLKLIF